MMWWSKKDRCRECDRNLELASKLAHEMSDLRQELDCVRRDLDEARRGYERARRDFDAKLDARTAKMDADVEYWKALYWRAMKGGPDG